MDLFAHNLQGYFTTGAEDNCIYWKWNWIFFCIFDKIKKYDLHHSSPSLYHVENYIEKCDQK